jgi:hypothetical protein
MGTYERKTRRGDWTPLELFLAGVRRWEVEMSRRLARESNVFPP